MIYGDRYEDKEAKDILPGDLLLWPGPSEIHTVEEVDEDHIAIIHRPVRGGNGDIRMTFRKDAKVAVIVPKRD